MYSHAIHFEFHKKSLGGMNGISMAPNNVWVCLNIPPLVIVPPYRRFIDNLSTWFMSGYGVCLMAYVTFQFYRAFKALLVSLIICSFPAVQTRACCVAIKIMCCRVQETFSFTIFSKKQ